jgi:hypothetical protein
VFLPALALNEENTSGKIIISSCVPRLMVTSPPASLQGHLVWLGTILFVTAEAGWEVVLTFSG